MHKQQTYSVTLLNVACGEVWSIVYAVGTHYDGMVGKILSDVPQKLYKVLRVTIGNVHTDVLHFWDSFNNLLQFGIICI